MCVALGLSLAVVSGCGGSGTETERDRVVAAIESVQDAFAAGKYRMACAGLAARPRRQIGSVGHGRKPTTCTRDLQEFQSSTVTSLEGTGRGLRFYPKPDVVDVRVDRTGSRARATLAFDRGADFDVPLVKARGRWRLADFFGVSAPPPQGLR